jgi:hypothetical protein
MDIVAKVVGEGMPAHKVMGRQEDRKEGDRVAYTRS